MSTENGVYVGKFCILYGKGEYYPDCSPLFTDSKKKRHLTCLDSDSDYSNCSYCLFERTSVIKNRLNIMGYSLNQCRSIWNSTKNFDGSFSIDDLLSVLRNVKIDENTPSLNKLDWSFWTHVVFESKNNTRLDVEYDSFDFESYFFCSIDPLVKLRLACEACSDNVEFEWDIFDMIEAKYYTEAAVFHGIDQKYKVTLITEGSSDTRILSRTIQHYAPELYDLFEFIDMENNYPFTGTGNMGNLFKGVVKLKVMNRMLFIFDNDAEGNAKAQSLLEIDHPSNIMITALPDLVELENVSINGPTGSSRTNVNGIACSIECFLDFSPINNEPKFEYKSQIKDTNMWQGEICNKRQLNGCIDRIGKDEYNHSKLLRLITHIKDIIAGEICH